MHTSGDHSICSPARCSGAEAAARALAVADAEASSMSTLGRSGQALIDEYDVEGLGPVHRRLVLEAARIVDRLDRLDRLIAGDTDTWARLDVPRQDDGTPVRVVLNVPMGEARQQAVALRALAAELRAARPKADAAPAEEDPLERRRRERAERESDTA
jgi:hypothetical protein